jgi:hypothetical protein
VRFDKDRAMDLLVMENIFYERSLTPVYDLKGSERARWCKDDPNDPTTVLLDENLKRSILSAPLLVPPPRVSPSCGCSLGYGTLWWLSMVNYSGD